MRLRQGDFDDETVYDDAPLEAARGLGRRPARGSCTSSTSTARGRASRSRSTTWSGSPRELGVPVQYGGGLRVDRRRPRRAARRRRARDPRHRGVHATSTSSTRSLAAFGERVVVSVDVARRHVATVGLDGDDELPAADGDRAAAGPRRAVVRLHGRRPRRDARGPRPRRGRARSPAPCAGASSTPAASARSTTCARCAAAAGQPRRRDLRQGALRGALHDRRGPGRARRGAER